MAELKPLRALHYDPAVAGTLADVVSPPYDVIDADQRQALVAKSPFNVVGIDLPVGEDRYDNAAALLDSWKQQGVVTTDAEDALWAMTQDYTGPDGDARTRRGFFARVRVTDYGPGRIRPHERTHPGPKEDRLRLTRATRANLSPIFSLYSDPHDLAWQALEPHTAGDPWGDVTDPDGTRHRIWRVADPQAVAQAIDALEDTELLIADGHHRYETARVYADEIGGDGAHRYVLMCLVALEDPGLTVFPTHRLVSGLDAAQQEALRDAIKRDFEIHQVTRDEIAPPPGDGPLELGYIDSHHRQPHRLTLRSQEIADAALADMPPAYRRLDVGVLETLLLKGALGLTDDDISHLDGFGYARDVQQALDLVDSAAYDAAFLVRPTPVQQVREIAASGQNMPPKSTYFFPKVLTGLLFNPLT
ncbi:MAG TPA: DUF1015 domain-containing protein [Solirubrobacteraceae bacterium]|jgi:uncharacterized protein (DUF1015 family)|nr:DUF1015 domain-containing protein [Solirubrobacteraceae bacterium]